MLKYLFHRGKGSGDALPNFTFEGVAVVLKYLFHRGKGSGGCSPNFTFEGVAVVLKYLFHRGKGSGDALPNFTFEGVAVVLKYLSHRMEGSGVNYNALHSRGALAGQLCVDAGRHAIRTLSIYLSSFTS